VYVEGLYDISISSQWDVSFTGLVTEV